MRSFYTIILAFFCLAATAQVVEVDAQFNHIVYNELIKQKNNQAFKIQVDTISLPFFDDFAYKGPFPSQENWIDQNVFINNTIGKNPPSVGMATFDGLNAGGTPYGGATESDVLTSTFIDLSNFTDLDSIFLSFYIQPAGNGDIPEAADSLQLQFKNNAEEWETIQAFSSSEVGNEFNFFAVPVLNNDFFHEGFQFRFINKAGSGYKDFWHLDYVKMVPNGSSVPFSSDIAFVRAPSNMLKNYTAMPWHHFTERFAEEINNEMAINLFNHFDETNTAEPSSFSIIEKVTGIIVLDEPELLKLDASVNQKDVPSRTFVEYTNPIPAYVSELNNSAFDNEESLAFIFEYHFDQNEETNLTLANNTVRRTTNFENYLAYDDGTGETNLAAQGEGTQIAVKFTANVSDSLKAVQIHIPHINSNVEDQFFNLKVWIGDLDSDPVFERDLLRPYYADNAFDTLQGFTTYRLQNFFEELEPVFIPKGDFFIGWQQVSNETEDAIPIGYDLNSPLGFDNTFQNLGGGWGPLASFIPKGSLMIRPVLGEEAAINTETIELETTLDQDFKASPNPSNGILNLSLQEGNLADFSIEIINAAGQLVQTMERASENITLSLENGYYKINLIHRKSLKRYSENLIIIK